MIGLPSPERTSGGGDPALPPHPTEPGSGERAGPGDRPADGQGLHPVGALVGVQRLDVAAVADHAFLEQDPGAAEEVEGVRGDLAGGAGVVHLGGRGLLSNTGTSNLVASPLASTKTNARSRPKVNSNQTPNLLK